MENENEIKPERPTSDEFNEDRRQSLRWYVRGKELICEQVGVQMVAGSQGAIISRCGAERTMQFLSPGQCVTSRESGNHTFTLQFANELYVARTRDFAVQTIWDSQRPYAPVVLQTWKVADLDALKEWRANLLARIEVLEQAAPVSYAKAAATSIESKLITALEKRVAELEGFRKDVLELLPSLVQIERKRKEDEVPF